MARDTAGAAEVGGLRRVKGIPSLPDPRLDAIGIVSGAVGERRWPIGCGFTSPLPHRDVLREHDSGRHDRTISAEMAAGSS
ncbi:hypothetical protein [Marinactinospora rubrisoli]|uniref:Uncharacterized protein n=1 Tax=Marinactinospora rubrisoli TaxID=2715399 RepID=A0ABW2KDT6_9ACTN